MKIVSIAIDGPAGAGKSTIAKIIASKLKIMYIDTGAMYRAVTLEIMQKDIAIDDISSIKKLLASMKIEFKGNKVFLNDKDVSEDIRTQKVGSLVSHVSAIEEVRNRMVELQRQLAADSSVVMDGRDIGTNVLKSADVKIFLTASVDERAKRRYNEMVDKGYQVRLEDIKQEISTRDKIDSSRQINPLTIAEDAILVDTSQKGIEVVVDEILDIVRERWEGVL